MGNLFCYQSEEIASALEDSSATLSNLGLEAETEAAPDGPWRVSLGAGCYWGTEKFIAGVFPKRADNPPGSILEGKVGFMGPKSAPTNPTYRDVCSGKTKYVEVFDVEFTGGAAYFEAMMRFFFMFHDPTTINRQGNDTGTQYASVVYCYNRAEFDIVTKVKNELQELLNKKLLKGAYGSVRVTTSIRMVESPFFVANADHQKYLEEHPQGYCNHGFKFRTWPGLSPQEDQ